MAPCSPEPQGGAEEVEAGFIVFIFFKMQIVIMIICKIKIFLFQCFIITQFSYRYNLNHHDDEF